ncbi:MAG: hypothetical protein J3R72DRAFT_492776 [Linnemannia gamsii]|nr:MAG: hypothetical protein J3R72DRAFT_492776 [Linnemannia gamsii]
MNEKRVITLLEGKRYVSDAAGEAYNRKNTERGTKIYGAESNPFLAKALQKRANKDSKIEPGGIWQHRLLFGILCLCSILETEMDIHLLYQLLKLGSYLFVNEHVKVLHGETHCCASTDVGVSVLLASARKYHASRLQAFGKKSILHNLQIRLVMRSFLKSSVP